MVTVIVFAERSQALQRPCEDSAGTALEGQGQQDQDSTA